ncbi:YybH family protein [Robiginitalea sp. IMCC44478]|uniref:YybH family protein n=1 Tax=Robiginitalea sp. IMCC44478 TaxID=3459122 RepID=UPI0040430890
MNRIIFSLFLALMVLQACKDNSASDTTMEAASPSPEEKVQAVRSEIEEINNKVTALMKAGAYEEAGQYFAEDLVQYISGQPPVLGRQAWVESQKAAAAMGEWDLQLEVLDLALDGHMAVERGRGVQTFTANETSPMPSFQLTGDYMVYWKRKDSTWVIQWDYVALVPQEGMEAPSE